MVTRPTWTWGSADEAVPTAEGGGAYYMRRRRYWTALLLIIVVGLL